MSGEIWLIVLTAALIIVGSVSVCYESGVLAGIVLALYAAIGYWAGYIDLNWIREHAMTVLVGVVAYVAFGAIWMVFYWYRYSVRLLATYKATKVEWETSKSQKTMQEYWQNRMPYSDWVVPPLAAKHKATLLRVMVYWPFSVIEYMLTRVVKELYTAIYNHLSHVLQRISDAVWKDV